MVRTFRSIFVVTLVAALMCVAAGGAFAAKGGGGKGSHGGGGNTTTTCVQATPAATIDNTWAWGASGSWGTPGQELTYAIDVLNNDVGCGSSTFVVTLSAPDGFAVSMSAGTITLSSASTGYLFAHVTSPATAVDGDYPLIATVDRVGTAGSTAASSYKVYSSDSLPPSLYWMNPSDGGVLSGTSVYVGFASSDDHAVKKLEVAIDGAVVASAPCDNVASSCQLSYKWSLRGAQGSHTATFTSTDWMGNVATHAATFTVA